MTVAGGHMSATSRIVAGYADQASGTIILTDSAPSAASITPSITAGSPPASGAPGVPTRAGSKFNARAAARRFPYREHRSCAKWIGGLSA